MDFLHTAFFVGKKQHGRLSGGHGFKIEGITQRVPAGKQQHGVIGLHPGLTFFQRAHRRGTRPGSPVLAAGVLPAQFAHPGITARLF